MRDDDTAADYGGGVRAGAWTSIPRPAADLIVAGLGLIALACALAFFGVQQNATALLESPSTSTMTLGSVAGVIGLAAFLTGVYRLVTVADTIAQERFRAAVLAA